MIGVLGLGYVGLTTALGFASKGFRVTGFDIDRDKTDQLSKGKIPIAEPYPDTVVRKHLNTNLRFTDRLDKLVAECDVIFFCVGTPTSESGEADLAFLKKAVRDSLDHVKPGDHKHLVIKSTVPPSTTADVVRPLIEASGFAVGREIGLTNNPEFLREGSAWDDFVNPDRVIIGQHDDASGETIEALYEHFAAPVFRVSLNSGEFIKYLSNTMLATMISFANEMSMIGSCVGGIDVAEAFRLLHLDRRWSGTPAGMTNYVYPGCGFGGYCLPKDTQAMVTTAAAHGYDPTLLRQVLAVNQKAKEHLVQQITTSSNPENQIGILGLAFKPECDDVRGTPASDVIRELLRLGYSRITAYDPLAMDQFRQTYQLPISYSDSLDQLMGACDVVVITTAWSEFKQVRKWKSTKRIIDGRYFL